MNKTVTFTWIILIALTVISALMSRFDGAFVVILILVLSALKFFGIAFQFMEMRKAHVFWKVLVIGFICVFGIGLFVVL